MAARKRWLRFAIVSVGVLLASLVFLYLGLKTGRVYEKNQAASRLSKSRCLLWSLKEVAGLIDFHSQDGQDRWIVHEVFPGVDDGFYVEVGSGDGVIGSNTKALDDLGWDGICIDPFPTGMESRECKLVEAVVDSRTGETVRFKAAGFVGGIQRYLDEFSEANLLPDAETVELTTTTLDEILKRAGAPPFIHYMSIDIEGAELAALRGFSFSKYEVGAFTIEHNYQEPRRTNVRKLLESEGYVRVRSLAQDDCYVSAAGASRSR